MRYPAYHFTTHWSVPGTCRDVAFFLSDIEGTAQWWPSLYHRVAVVKPGDEQGIGQIVDVETKGFLPYLIRWRYEVIESDPPHGFIIKATGDVDGQGRWTFRQQADRVAVTYDWQVQMRKPVIARLSPVLRPLLIWNHHYVMKQGEIGLKKQLEKLTAANSPRPR